MAKWTTEQLNAINTLDKNVLVSAAAGSGKTAVLVERIKKIVIEEKVSVDNLLVVTFTKAAAAEMKDRLVKEIKKTISSNPKSEEAKYLKKQLMKIGYSDISTIHSFASKIVKKYFFMVDVDSSFKMGDETICVLLRKDAMDEVFEELLIEKDESFLNFIRGYSKITNRNELKKEVISFYLKIMSIAKPFDFVHDAVNKYTCTEETLLESEIMNYVFDYAKKEIEKSIMYLEKTERLLLEESLTILAEKNNQDIEELKIIYNAIVARDYDKVKTAFEELKFTVLRSTKEEKEKYEAIQNKTKALRQNAKNIVNQIKKRYFYSSTEEITKTINYTSDTLKAVEKILKRFHSTYTRIKRDKNILDFNDLEHLALEILENENVRKEYKEKYKYIFVDEYQDTNSIQEKIISSIENGKNAFRVGDIKQCIYGFRMSDPALFKERYNEYKKGHTDSCKIDLNKNFRSKGSIIDGINKIFENTIEDYEDDSRLNMGLECKEEYEFPIELHCVYKDDEKLRPINEKDNPIDEELNFMNKMEKEAVLLAKLIKENLGQEIYDNKLGCTRKIAKKDIVILYRSGKVVAETIRKVLEHHDIDSYIEEKEGYFGTLEISMIVELLRVIDNRKKDIALISSLRTDFFCFDTNDLTEIRINYPKGNFYDGLIKYLDDGENRELKEKCRYVIQLLEKWKKRSFYTPINQFIWELLLETGLYDYVASLKGGKKRQANLRALVDRANMYMENGDGSVYGFLRYVELLNEREVEIGQANLTNENDDVVRIMTIHKSKGLEFPVVIIPNLSKNLIKPGKKPLLEMDKDFGIGIHMVDFENHIKKDTLIQKTIQDKGNNITLQEEMRIMYVAFTRAKDKLILVGTVRKKDVMEELDTKNVLDAKSHMDILYALKDHADIKLNNISENVIKGFHVVRKENEIKIIDYLDNLKAKSEEYSYVDRRLSFKYENVESVIMSKTSASQMMREESLEEIKIQSPEALGVKKENVGMIIGTVNHAFLEHIDFKKAKELGEKYLIEMKSILSEKNIINEKLIDKVMIDKIKNLLDHEIFDRLLESDFVRKEQEFTIIIGEEGEEQLVQGIIDCFFEEDGKIILIDYKSNADLNNIEEKYKGQIELYKKALEINYGMEVKESYIASISTGEMRRMDK